MNRWPMVALLLVTGIVQAQEVSVDPDAASAPAAAAAADGGDSGAAQGEGGPGPGVASALAETAAAEVSGERSVLDDDAVAEGGVAGENAEAVVAAAGGTRTMSGMSILGNEEAPKSLVIVPWKSSEIGDGIGVYDSMDDRAVPVDKEVFLREVHYFDLRAGDLRAGGEG